VILVFAHLSIPYFAQRVKIPPSCRTWSLNTPLCIASNRNAEGGGGTVR